MKFVFNGVPGEQHEEIEQFGLTFPRGEPVQVDDPKVQAKLKGHPHFKAWGETPEPEADAAKTPAPAAKHARK